MPFWLRQQDCAQAGSFPLFPITLRYLRRRRRAYTGFSGKRFIFSRQKLALNRHDHCFAFVTRRSWLTACSDRQVGLSGAEPSRATVWGEWGGASEAARPSEAGVRNEGKRTPSLRNQVKPTDGSAASPTCLDSSIKRLTRSCDTPPSITARDAEILPLTTNLPCFLRDMRAEHPAFSSRRCA